MASLPDAGRKLRDKRMLTEQALLIFETKVERYTAKLQTIKQEIDSILREYEELPLHPTDDLAIRELKNDLVRHARKYEDLSEEYNTYLKGTRSVASVREGASHRLLASTLRTKISRILDDMNSRLDKRFSSEKSQSVSRCKSHTISLSNHTVRQRQNAKIELQAAKVELEFAEKEANLLKQQAAIEAERKLLESRKALAVAETTLEALESELDDNQDRESIHIGAGTDDRQQSSEERVSNFVLSHPQQKNVTSALPNRNEEYCDYSVQNKVPEYDTRQNMDKSSKQIIDDHTPVLNPQAKPYFPSEMDYLTKYILKKDLISSRFTVYDDDPTNYLAWKSTFKSILLELQVSHLEHLDLLVKWLGPESKRQVKSIRVAHINDPGKALKLAWERLDSRFGSPEIIEHTLQRRISVFPTLQIHQKKELYDLADLASEIEGVKSDDRNTIILAYFDSSYGVNKLVSKLPPPLQDKWTVKANEFKLRNNGQYPPFTFFCTFLQNLAKMKNDPGFSYELKGFPQQRSGARYTQVSSQPFSQRNVKSKKTEVSMDILDAVSCHKTDLSTDFNAENEAFCPLHKKKHSFNECKAFRAKPIQERMKFIRTNGICFRCCGDRKHLAKDCKSDVKCSICKSLTHPTALHQSTVQDEGEETRNKVISSCTQICETSHGTGKSCAKILPVKVYPENKPGNSRIIYGIMDDQSNQTLATSTFFDSFRENGPTFEYALVSCAGRKSMSGRRGTGYIVESLDGSTSLKLPTVIECDEVPNNRDEIPSPQVAAQFPHLQDIEPLIAPVDNTLDIEILIGRDLLEAHHVLDQKIGGSGLPFAQKLPLGWIILGQVCLDRVHLSNVISTNKTYFLPSGRPSYFEPCDNHLSVNSGVFQKTEHDEKIGPSLEDQQFMETMDSSFKRDNDGRWVAPLPFRKGRPILPNNKTQAFKRAMMFDRTLTRNPEKLRHAQDFMQKIFENRHAERAPQVSPDAECWYLPLFGIYHPRKPDSIRLVFDSSAKHRGLSLNDVLIKGPDLTNDLLGILLRFRQNEIAITADVEQMFYNFRVINDHRDFLRFLWHPDGNLDMPLEEFQMTVHVFGNTPSPSIATFGLRKSVQRADSDVQNFVIRNFYVDDGLTSCSTVEEAVSLMKRTQQALHEGGRLRLHKVASNSKLVLQQFSPDDLAKDLKNVDFGHETLPVQRSLGMSWDIETDTIIFRVSRELKPFTRRGMLSTINSLFDPVGFTAPVTLQGKLLLREIMMSSSPIDWDEPLQDTFRARWEKWVNSLQHLEDMRIPRTYGKISMCNAVDTEVHVFSDASKEAIAGVAYMKLITKDSADVSFLLGKAKVAPVHGHTIPRLELCAAVLAVELAEIIREQLDRPKDAFHFYSDSQVVLGYISAEARRFHIYVSNRVSRIRSFCGPEQWTYIPSECNPADIATRKFNTSNLSHSIWLKGPSIMENPSSEDTTHFPLINADKDVEVKKEVVSAKTKLELPMLGCTRFNRFSTWNSLVRAISTLKKLATKIQAHNQHTHLPAEQFIIKQVQQEVFSEEVQVIMKGKRPPSNSSLLPLNPVMDADGILLVGGRLKRLTSLKQGKEVNLSCHPIIIPKNHHIAVLLIRHFHNTIHHQGRHLTEGAVRAAGYWIVGGKRLINSIIKDCLICKKLRGSFGWTKMADLPVDRLETGPPFTFVGVDTFGPWPITFRRTRGVQQQKRWAILFTCLVSRGVHIELIEELSSASFINALRRFTAIRGPVKQFRSDRGTNFVGGAHELNIDTYFVEKGPIAKYLRGNNTAWIFNPPKASHFGGVWERMIGSCRRILDALILENKHGLTHEVLATFMMEVCAILNSRPLLPISSDPEKPEVLSPCQLFIQKTFTQNAELPKCDFKDALKSQWKNVQFLADKFWTRWKSEYLHILQTRPKWESGGMKFKESDIVLLKECDSPRNEWPMGVIDETFQSEDNIVRKVKVGIFRGDVRVSCVRPISQVVKLLEVDSE